MLHGTGLVSTLGKCSSKLRFHAQLNIFKDEWQLFLPNADWILEND
jgi:hypothetical protein